MAERAAAGFHTLQLLGRGDTSCRGPQWPGHGWESGPTQTGHGRDHVRGPSEVCRSFTGPSSVGTSLSSGLCEVMPRWAASCREGDDGKGREQGPMDGEPPRHGRPSRGRRRIREAEEKSSLARSRGTSPGRQEKKVKKKRRSSSVKLRRRRGPRSEEEEEKRKEGEDKGGYVKGRRTSVWEHRIGPKPDQEKEVEEESKEGGQKEGQEGEQQLQSVRGNLQREQRFPGGGVSAVWPRSSGENGLEEVSRLFDNEHGRVHPECRGHPIGTALEFGVDGHPTYLQSILENDATTQDDRGHGSRDPDVELCPGPPTAGEGLGRPAT